MDGLNWYVYCSSNPVNRVDVTGMWDVGLRDFVESLGGTVTPHKHFGLFGLKSITVELNGKTKTYTCLLYTSIIYCLIFWFNSIIVFSTSFISLFSFSLLLDNTSIVSLSPFSASASGATFLSNSCSD